MARKSGKQKNEQKLVLQRARGTRDFSPEEKIIRDEVVGRLKRIFENFGFSPLETPVIERFDVLSSKYAGGAEILKETFTFKDQGDRDLGLRYDLTVPFCRFVGMNPNTKMPFKRYQIGQVFRDGPIKLGRYREFWQCDVDIVGTKNMMADAEFVMIPQAFFRDLGFEVIVEVNNRKLLDGIIKFLEIPADRKEDIIVSIDKLKKAGEKEVKKELKEKGIDEKQIKKLFEIFKIMKTLGKNSAKIKQLKKMINSDIAQEGLEELDRLLGFLDCASDQSNVVLELTLARGLSYYTGTVFEVFLKNPKEGDVKSSLAGGGRYDKMIGSFLRGGSKNGIEKEGAVEYPAVGISFGIEPIVEQMKIFRQQKEESIRKTVTQIYVVPIKSEVAVEESLKIISTLRKEGINADIDLVGRGISKNLDYANSLGIPFVAIIGPKEVEKNRITLRNMVSGKEELLALNEVCRRLKG